MGKKPKKTQVAREPLQVYLAADERALLDRLAESTGLSRAEVLRRGLKSFAAASSKTGSPMLDFIMEHKDGDWRADWPTNVARNHDEYLAEAYLDKHDQ